ncbi:hypothetical protein L0244_12205 [bacterium]|nr:hypothetical protein [bacterium]
MNPKMLMEICKEAMGEIKFTQKGKRFTVTGSNQWIEFFSNLVSEIAIVDAGEKPMPKRTARRKGLREMEDQVFDVRETLVEGK